VPPFEHPSHALKIHGVAVYLIKLATIPESYPAIRLVGAMAGQDVIEVGQLCCVGRENLTKLIGRRLPEGEILRNLVRRAEVHAAGIVVATWVTDSGRPVLDFDGINDEVNAGNSAALDVVGAFTVEAWMKPTQTGGLEAGIAGKEMERFTLAYNNANNRAYWYVAHGANNWSASVTKANVRFNSPPVDMVREEKLAARFAYALDPDGIVVELYQPTN
jgi:hypothetical protein